MNWQLIRDVLLFFGGLAGVTYETVGQSTDRPTLLILFAAMMGLPAFLQNEQSPAQYKKRKVRKHRNNDSEELTDDSE